MQLVSSTEIYPQCKNITYGITRELNGSWFRTKNKLKCNTKFKVLPV